jgi:hypothetical protein
MRIGDTFKATEVIHDGAIGFDVELKALVTDSNDEAVLAIHSQNRHVYLFDRHGPNAPDGQWINYYSLEGLKAQIEAVEALL